jgi:hypothetical protein
LWLSWWILWFELSAWLMSDYANQRWLLELWDSFLVNKVYNS